MEQCFISGSQIQNHSAHCGALITRASSFASNHSTLRQPRKLSATNTYSVPSRTAPAVLCRSLLYKYSTPIIFNTINMPGDTVYPIEAVTVYAASGARVAKKFTDHAYELGAAIAREGWVQVNGGGATGLMGAATRGGLDNNGIVDCVNLKMFSTTNQSKGFRKVYIEENMQDRKNGLCERGDAIVALPGGLGTLDEIAEQMCQRQLQFHTKPIVLINTDGHYNPIREFIRNGEESLFISGGMSQVIHFSDTPADAIQYLKGYKPITINKESVNSSELNALQQ